MLVLHLKRFDAFSARKIERFVGFPLKGLNMAPYVYEWRNAGGGKGGGKEGEERVKNPTVSEEGAAAVVGVEGEGEGEKKTTPMDTTTGSSSSSSSSSSGSNSNSNSSRTPIPATTTTTNTTNSKKTENTNDLFAVCEHLGTSLQQGHYKAYVQEGVEEGGEGGREGGRTPAWYVCNDTWVLPASEEEVSSAQGYVLFYIRRGWNPSGH